MGVQERRLYQNSGESAGTLIWQGAHISKRKYLSLLCYINICFCVVKATTLVVFLLIYVINDYYLQRVIRCLRTSYVTYVPLFHIANPKNFLQHAPLYFLYFCQKKICASAAYKMMVIHLQPHR